ncbi:Uncharacterised protein [Vibrio cholerae]|nr:Uncharacterised protein [Vibrio cholerae]CSI66193.1 Uncharacterised protein [Vibrio cholerae]
MVAVFAQQFKYIGIQEHRTLFTDIETVQFSIELSRIQGWLRDICVDHTLSSAFECV